MALILAIEPDKKQASAVRSLARGMSKVDIVVADSTPRALDELDGRVPDLILTSLLLSPRDEAALDTHLRHLDTAGVRVPTLVIPVLGPATRRSKGGLLTKLRKPRKSSGTEGCDPATFAAQIGEYLERAASERAQREMDEEAGISRFPLSAVTASAFDPPVPFEAQPEAEEAVLDEAAFEAPVFEPRVFEMPAAEPPVFETPAPETIAVEASSAETFAEETATSEPDAETILVETIAEETTLETEGTIAGEDRAEEPLEAAEASWVDVALEEPSDSGLEITVEPIDLSRFVEELEAVVARHDPGAGPMPVVDDGVTIPPDQPEVSIIDIEAQTLEMSDLEAALSAFGAPVTANVPAGPSRWAAADASIVSAGASSSAAAVVEAAVFPAAAPELPVALAALRVWWTLDGQPSDGESDTGETLDFPGGALTDFIEVFEAQPVATAEPSPEPELVVVEASAGTWEPKRGRRERESRPWLSLATRYHWPLLEGVVAAGGSSEDGAPGAIAADEVEEVISAQVSAAPAVPEEVGPATAQLVEILSAIRRDIQELRAERTETAEDAAEETPYLPQPAQYVPDEVPDLHEPAPKAAARPKAKKVSPSAPKAPRKKKRKPQPKQDEWGFFDPDQCGFAALLAKLEEIESDEPPDQS